MLLRALIFVASSFIVPWVQFYLPLNICHTISCTGILFGFVHNYFLEGQPITKRQCQALGLSMFGILLIINGRLLYEAFVPEYEFSSEF
jgi:hypothetical protein